MKTIRTMLATTAFILAAMNARADEPAQCKKTVTIETAPNGDTVIRTHKVCTVSEVSK